MVQLHLKCTHTDIKPNFIHVLLPTLYAQCKLKNGRASLGNWWINFLSLEITGPLLLQKNSQFALFHFVLSNLLNKSLSSDELFWAVLPIIENPEFKIAYPSVNQIPQSIFSFLSESFFISYFFYHRNPLLCQRDVKVEPSQSLSVT